MDPQYSSAPPRRAAHSTGNSNRRTPSHPPPLCWAISTPLFSNTNSHTHTHEDPAMVGGTPSSGTPTKRRGRPPGSGKKQLDALGISGVGFTPHVIMVPSGEDIASKIMAFSKQGPRTVCILSANGSVHNVTLRQPGLSGGVVTYEGIGSFPTSDSNVIQTGTLSVSLAGSDGRVLGGGVAGMLNAASLVQIVVGSFAAEEKKPKDGPSSNPGNPQLSPPSDIGSSSDSDDGNPLAPDSGPYGNTGHPVQNVPIYSNMGWV